jgi:hypothetical protein
MYLVDVSGKLEAIDVKDIFESPDDGQSHSLFIITIYVLLL